MLYISAQVCLKHSFCWENEIPFIRPLPFSNITFQSCLSDLDWIWSMLNFFNVQHMQRIYIEYVKNSSAGTEIPTIQLKNKLLPVHFNPWFICFPTLHSTIKHYTAYDVLSFHYIVVQFTIHVCNLTQNVVYLERKMQI